MRNFHEGPAPAGLDGLAAGVTGSRGYTLGNCLDGCGDASEDDTEELTKVWKDRGIQASILQAQSKRGRHGLWVYRKRIRGEDGKVTASTWRAWKNVQRGMVE